MNRFVTHFAGLFAVFLLVAFVAACTDEVEEETVIETPDQEMVEEDTASDLVEARMENGIQVVEITAGPEGYEPWRIGLQAGVPARLVFTRTTPSECLQQVQIPAFGIERTDLPMNEPVAIEFTPSEAGEFTFVCGMDMQSGTMVVRS